MSKASFAIGQTIIFHSFHDDGVTMIPKRPLVSTFSPHAWRAFGSCFKRYVKMYLCFQNVSCKISPDPAWNLPVLLLTIVQFTGISTNDETEALTRDFFLTPKIILFRQPNPIRRKSVSSKEHSTNRAFTFIALACGVKYTNPGHQKHDFRPQLWNHFEMTVKGRLVALRLRTYQNNLKYYF